MSCSTRKSKTEAKRRARAKKRLYNAYQRAAWVGQDRSMAWAVNAIGASEVELSYWGNRIGDVARILHDAHAYWGNQTASRCPVLGLIPDRGSDKNRAKKGTVGQIWSYG